MTDKVQKEKKPSKGYKGKGKLLLGLEKQMHTAIFLSDELHDFVNVVKEGKVKT